MSNAAFKLPSFQENMLFLNPSSSFADSFTRIAAVRIGLFAFLCDESSTVPALVAGPNRLICTNLGEAPHCLMTHSNALPLCIFPSDPKATTSFVEFRQSIWAWRRIASTG